MNLAFPKQESIFVSLPIVPPLAIRDWRACHLYPAGTFENAQATAAHESPHTTKLYDRTSDGITLDEVERDPV
jgi:hypothetical protein